MSSRKVAVVTDSLSADFYFPKWHDYYGRLFGHSALHVATLAGSEGLFSAFPLAEVRTIHASYDDSDRLTFITSYVEELLETHDVVVRVDTDEFLVAEPRLYHDLRDYVDRLDQPYVTARGFDVFQKSEEPPLDLRRPILGEQRGFAFGLSALCKTAITSVPLTWDRGFHMTSTPPVFHHLYLFHMKRADIDLQERWNAYMAVRIHNDPFIRGYYETPRSQIEAFHAELSRRGTEEGDEALNRTEYLSRVMDAVRFDQGSGMWVYSHDLDTVNVTIPPRFRGLI